MTITEIDQIDLAPEYKLSKLYEQIDQRMEEKGVELSFDKCRKHELKFVTREEWVVRSIWCFLCGASNCGLQGYSNLGMKLLAELRLVGLNGCADALERFVALDDELEAYEWQLEKKQISEERYLELYDEWSERVERIEKTAGSGEQCADILWKFVFRNHTAFD